MVELSSCINIEFLWNVYLSFIVITANSVVKPFPRYKDVYAQQNYKDSSKFNVSN